MKSEEGHPSRDDVGRLVRLAGKRREVPRDRMARIREQAHAQWRAQVGRRSRRRTGWAVAGLATAATLLLAVGLSRFPDREGPRGVPQAAILVESLLGPASSDDGTLAAGDRLAPGNTLVTAADGGVAIRLASGHSVRLDSSTRVRLLEDGALGLDHGVLYVDSGADGRPRAIDVETPMGVVEEIGTQYELRLENDALRVRLREGAVLLHAADGAHRVEAGHELRLDDDGAVTRSAIATHGDDWQWVARLTPMIDLEGKSARYFLDWISREQGWELAFDEPRVAEAAEEIVLGGTVERLTLDEALNAVLPASGLTYRVESGILVVGLSGRLL